MTTKYKVGDIVQLKSGGPAMTVSHPENESLGVKCQWFGGKKLDSGYFPAQSLKTYSEPKTEK